MTTIRTYVDEDYHLAQGGTIEYRSGGKCYNSAPVVRSTDGAYGLLLGVALTVLVIVLAAVLLAGGM